MPEMRMETETETETANQMEEMRSVEKKVREGDLAGLQARWESGRYMVKCRDGKKQLPSGLLKAFTKALRVHRAELTARMKFAEKFPDADALTNVISKFKTWYSIKQNALTERPRAGRADAARNRPEVKADRALKALDELDPEGLSADTVKKFEEAFQRFRNGVKTLAA
jgi:hypothetical protein